MRVRIGDHVVEDSVVHMVAECDDADKEFFMLHCNGRYWYSRHWYSSADQIMETTQPVSCLWCLRRGLVG